MSRFAGVFSKPRAVSCAVTNAFRLAGSTTGVAGTTPAVGTTGLTSSAVFSATIFGFIPAKRACSARSSIWAAVATLPCWLKIAAGVPVTFGVTAVGSAAAATGTSETN